MWLINVHSHELQEHIIDREVPPYAILSHTWGREELSFHEWQARGSVDIRAKHGYHKIEYCCHQAKVDGFDWVWVDTCCIDKRSSAELSEAINSMFKWYKRSAVCYAYLEDVTQPNGLNTDISHCRWLTRGWTLQELIAPSEVVFYGADWQRIGTKTELTSAIEKVTGVSTEYLLGADLETASVSRRMSWAAKRETTRTEDIAYCLMGLFDINMPLLYGEGEKAFQRLQEQIMKLLPEDHTLFAWGTLARRGDDPDELDDDLTDEDIDKIMFRELGTATVREYQPLLGLLAPSPDEFAASGNLIPAPWPTHLQRSFLRNGSNGMRGEVIGHRVSIQLPILYGPLDQPKPVWFRYISPDRKTFQFRPATAAMLLCGEANDSKVKYVFINLQYWGHGSFGRTAMFVPYEADATGYGIGSDDLWADTVDSMLSCMINTVSVGPEPRIAMNHEDFNMRCIHVVDTEDCTLATVDYSSHLTRIQDRILRPSVPQQSGYFVRYLLNFKYKRDSNRILCITLGRDTKSSKGTPRAYAEVEELELGSGKRFSTSTHHFRGKGSTWQFRRKHLPMVDVRAQREDEPGYVVDHLDLHVGFMGLSRALRESSSSGSWNFGISGSYQLDYNLERFQSVYSEAPKWSERLKKAVRLPIR